MKKKNRLSESEGQRQTNQPLTANIKAAVYSVVINSLQILSVLVLLVLVLTDGTQNTLAGLRGELLVLVLAVIVVWGAAADIREAVLAGNLTNRFGALTETVDQMTELNTAMRAQRHDFLNHLQVVYSLIEMEEYDEAKSYMDKVYGDIRALGVSLRTDNVPVNALIRAKMGECRQQGVACEMEARCSWKQLPIEDWQMCRVLGNLIDNALEAMRGRENSKLRILLSESLMEYRFEVENNGPDIDENKQKHIFDAGFSTKGTGRGMGLHISRSLIREAGGELTVRSGNGHTAFIGVLPRNEMGNEGH